MNWYLIVKYLNIVAVILMIGGVFARQLVRGAATKSDDVKLVASLQNYALPWMIRPWPLLITLKKSRFLSSRP